MNLMVPKILFVRVAIRGPLITYKIRTRDIWSPEPSIILAYVESFNLLKSVYTLSLLWTLRPRFRTQ